MRRLFLLMLLLVAIGLALLYATREPKGETPDVRRSEAVDATADRDAVLRGRARSGGLVGPREGRALLRGTGEASEAAEEPPVLLSVHLDLEGHPAGTPLDPPASVCVSGRWNTIDNFFYIGVARDVATSGTVEVDVRSLLGELGPLGRAPELMIQVVQPGALLRFRSRLVADVEGLLAGRGELDPLFVTLRPTTRVTGRVLTHDGKPLTIASVRAYPMPGSEPLPETANAVDVDGEGRFELRLAGEGRFLLVALAVTWDERQRLKGHRWSPQAHVIAFNAGQEPTPVEFRLDEGRWVEGEVVHPAHGTPGGDGRIRWEVVEHAAYLQGEPDRLAWVGGDVVWAEGGAAVVDGRFRLQGVPAVETRFAVEKLEDVCIDQPLGATLVGPAQKTVRLEPLCATFELTPAVEGGAATPDSWGVHIATTDEAAASWPRTVAPGTRILVSPETVYRIRVTDRRFAAATVELTSPAADEMSDVAIPLVPASRSELVVHLRMPDGTPHRGWAAIWMAETGSALDDPQRVWGTAAYAEDGVYQLQDVPDGSWRLHVRPGRTRFWGRPAGYVERTAQVAAPSGAEPAVTFVVEAGGRLVMSVTDAYGVPRAGSVRIRDAKGGSPPTVFVPEFSFLDVAERAAPGRLPANPTCWLATALAPGTYEVELTPDGGMPTTHTIHAEAGKTSAIAVTVE